MKVRGYRIELGEVEAVLREQEAVQECVVLAREDKLFEQRLVAYLVVESGQTITARELRTALSDRLPAYMIPSAFVFLDSLPLLPNGKLDRQALPAPEPGQFGVSRAGEPARKWIAELLAGLWSEVLARPQVGIDEDFFELGGHSLLATRLIAQVRVVFGIEVPLRALFEAPTVASLAHHLEGVMQTAPSAPAPALVALPRPDELPLSFAQERLWFLHQWAADRVWYNVAVALRLCGPLQVPALAWSLATVVERHEVLRTTIEQRVGQPVQVIAEPFLLPMPVIDLQGWVGGKREQQVSTLLRLETQRSFDLAKGPLLRVWLLKLDTQEHVLFLTLHHIVTDGWSMGVLVREITTLYRACINGQSSPLPALPIQYADYTI